MTLLLPLEPSVPPPSHPIFVNKPSNSQDQIDKVIKTILKAKRIVVVCGAGISVHAGIPDFRSPEGLFQSLKKGNPKEALASGKDLFDASVFGSETMTSLFCQMISQLSDLSEAAQPTPFHRLLHTLDTTGKLLRVYTQNIDAIEEKCGLTFGVPDFESKRAKARAKGKETPKETNPSTPVPTPTPVDEGSNPNADTGSSTSRLPTPSSSSAFLPRCIPLHGTLQTLHCQVCKHSFPLSPYLSSLSSGIPPDCPECISMEKTRQLIGKRARGIGKLRPSVVLYNEEHKDGEGVGHVVSRDLMGGKGKSGADLLLVVGTSLKVPGTKRMVREFAKAVHSRGSASAKEAEKDKEKDKKEKEKEKERDETNSGSASPGPEDAQSQQPMKALYLNLDFPVPTREWEGVFDAWIQGDAQTFAEMLRDEIERDTRAKEVAKENADERKRKRELKEKEKEQQALSAEDRTEKSTKSNKSKPSKNEGLPKKRKTEKESDSTPSSSHSTTPVKKKKLMVLLPTPKSLLKSKSASANHRSEFESSPSGSSKRKQKQEDVHVQLPLTAPPHHISFDSAPALPSPPSPNPPLLSPIRRSSHPITSFMSTDHGRKCHTTAENHIEHQSTHPHYSSHSSPNNIPRTPISKQHPSNLNWTLPTPDQSPALGSPTPHQQQHHPQRHSLSRPRLHHEQASWPPYRLSPPPSDDYHYYAYDHYSFNSEYSHDFVSSKSKSSGNSTRTKSRSRSPIRRAYSSSRTHTTTYFGARISSSPPRLIPRNSGNSRSHSRSRGSGSSGQTSRSSSSSLISTPVESESESESETETEEAEVEAELETDVEMTAEDDRPFVPRSRVTEKMSSFGLPLPTSHHISDADMDMEVDIESISDDDSGMTSPVDDFRNRLGLGMSCVRTTQVAG
ncbi:hypothetical protein VKT23_008405 [Stygiomarasmius scandens]|uniref:Deacetylase sirtuin-type domain-containing protein n=1 Tax=Marasmiellus scandens TaxID=2682957 RepID=A0ABR1JI47_9AGAR